MNELYLHLCCLLFQEQFLISIVFGSEIDNYFLYLNLQIRTYTFYNAHHLYIHILLMLGYYYHYYHYHHCHYDFHYDYYDYYYFRALFISCFTESNNLHPIFRLHNRALCFLNLLALFLLGVLKNVEIVTNIWLQYHQRCRVTLNFIA